jgi:hypothetical protein
MQHTNSVVGVGVGGHVLVSCFVVCFWRTVKTVLSTNMLYYGPFITAFDFLLGGGLFVVFVCSV